MTALQTHTLQPRRINKRRHRLGMGWHHIWEYDPPIENHMKRSDGTRYFWRETGESSVGCIMWLADRFTRKHLGMTAQDIFRQAYPEEDGLDTRYDWLDTHTLRNKWAEHTILPARWTPAEIRQLFEDLEDINYHRFLLKLIELIEKNTPTLAASLYDWCTPTPKAASMSTSDQ